METDRISKNDNIDMRTLLNSSINCSIQYIKKFSMLHDPIPHDCNLHALSKWKNMIHIRRRLFGSGPSKCNNLYKQLVLQPEEAFHDQGSKRLGVKKKPFWQGEKEP